MRTLTFEIEGMSCGHCLDAVRQALSATTGVRVDSVQLGRAVVTFDERVTAPAEIESAIDGAGYPATALPRDGD
jgi:copper chaperone CopZ